jgi:hypothetical protein
MPYLTKILAFLTYLCIHQIAMACNSPKCILQGECYSEHSQVGTRVCLKGKWRQIEIPKQPEKKTDKKTHNKGS